MTAGDNVENLRVPAYDDDADDVEIANDVVVARRTAVAVAVAGMKDM